MNSAKKRKVEDSVRDEDDDGVIGGSFEGFFGACRDVNSYQKLERIGEGTYGTVCTSMERLAFVNSSMHR